MYVCDSFRCLVEQLVKVGSVSSYDSVVACVGGGVVGGEQSFITEVI